MKNIKFFINRYLQGKGYNQEIDHSKLVQYINRKYSPKSYLERSFAQYKAQVHAYGNRWRLFFLGPFVFLFCFFYIMVNIARFINSAEHKKSNYKKTNVASTLPNIEMVPSCILSDKGVDDLRSCKKINLNKSDIKIQLRIFFKYMHHPYFVIKNIDAITRYSSIAKEYNKVLVSNEYSFTSSVITMYLNKNGVEVYNCMHGDKFINARDSFCTYDVFFIWDLYYESILNELKCNSNFVVSKCNFISINRTSKLKEDTITYFLQGGESEMQLRYIKDKLNNHAEKENIDFIKVRPHPRYNTVCLEDVFDINEIDTGQFSESFSRSRVVCGRYSTVLFQSYINKDDYGIPKVLLDMEFWKAPKEYIMLKKADGFF